MRRIDILALGVGLLASGGGLYWLFQRAGYDSLDAGIWSQGLLVLGLLGWVATYLFRVATRNMTYSQQRRAYEQTLLQEKLASLSPEDLAALQAEIEQEEQGKKPE
jgi:hypothetical protein